MNLKKFISGVSTLTIAASAFAGMTVTASAANYYSNDYEAADAAVDWSSPNAAAYLSIVEEGSNHYLGYRNTASQNSRSAHIDLSSKGVPADYVVEFDAKVSPGNNQTSQLAVYKSGGLGSNNADAGDPVIFLAPTAVNSSTWTVNGDSAKTVTLADSHGGTNNADDDPDTWYHFIVAVSGDKAYLTINNADGTENLAQTTLATGGALGGIKFKAGRYWWDFGIDNVVVRDVTADDLPSVPQADFTVQYVTDGGTTLQKTSNGSGSVGDAPALSASDKADFTENGQKYIYVSDDSANITISNDNSTVVTVTVREAASYAVSVVASVGTVLSSSDVFEGDSLSYAYPKYLTDENKKVTYETSYNTYSASVTPTDDTNIEIPYTAYEGTAYFVDHEKITSTANLDSSNYSGGRATRAVNDGVEAFTVVEAGTYDITVAASCRNVNNSSVFAIYKNSIADENLVYNDDVKGITQNNVQSNLKTKTGVELNKGDVIIIQGDNGQTWIDYVLAVQTASADPEITTPAITAADDTVTAVSAIAAPADVTEYGTDNASLWQATVTAKDDSYKSIKAKATDKTGKTAEASKELPTTITDGSIKVYIAVAANVDEIASLVVSFE